MVLGRELGWSQDRKLSQQFPLSAGNRGMLWVCTVCMQLGPVISQQEKPLVWKTKTESEGRAMAQHVWQKELFYLCRKSPGRGEESKTNLMCRELWEQARRMRDSTQTVWEGDKVQIRSCIYLIDILPLILMEILSPKACQWKPNPPLRDTQHCSKQNSDDDKVIFISSALTAPAPSFPPRFPFLAQAEKGEERLNDK